MVNTKMALNIKEISRWDAEILHTRSEGFSISDSRTA